MTSRQGSELSRRIGRREAPPIPVVRWARLEALRAVAGRNRRALAAGLRGKAGGPALSAEQLQTYRAMARDRDAIRSLPEYKREDDDRV